MRKMGSLRATRGQFVTLLASSGSNLGSLGSHFGALWESLVCHMGIVWGYFEGIGVTWGSLWSTGGHLEFILGDLGITCEPHGGTLASLGDSLG